MPDEFNRFLASALAPSAGLPDRQFVGRVQVLIALDERLAAQRRLMIRNLEMQLLALAAMGASAWWIGRAEPVASLFERSPAVTLAVLLSLFALLVVLLGRRPAAPLSKLNGS